MDKFQLAFAIWVEDYIKRKLRLKKGEFFEGVYYPDTNQTMSLDTLRQIKRFRLTKNGQVGRKLSYHDICAVANRLGKKPTTVIREVEQFLTDPLFIELIKKHKK